MPHSTPDSRQVSALFRSTRRKAFEASGLSKVDAVEDHLELASRQFDGGSGGGRIGEVIATRFEALAPQAQAMPAPVENLEAVGGAIAEYEEVAGQRSACRRFLTSANRPSKPSRISTGSGQYQS